MQMFSTRASGVRPVRVDSCTSSVLRAMSEVPMRFRLAALLMFLAIVVVSPDARADTPAARQYRDHTRVDYYLDDAGREQPIKTATDWSRRRQDILAGMQAAMGALPD